MGAADGLFDLRGRWVDSTGLKSEKERERRGAL